jgi:hypothetical protein
VAVDYGTHYVTTVTVDSRWAESARRAADASQAAYFREALANERDSVTTDLAGARIFLQALIQDDQVELRRLARARSDVRDAEHELRELNRLIGALDRRFGALWSVEH